MAAIQANVLKTARVAIMSARLFENRFYIRLIDHQKSFMIRQRRNIVRVALQVVPIRKLGSCRSQELTLVVPVISSNKI